MIAAIGTDGVRPVVWGLGETEAHARNEARYYDAAWASRGSAFVEVTPDIVARIKAGEVDCATLGIETRCDSCGRLVDAKLVAS